MSKRIDNLQPGSTVLLSFAGKTTEFAIFHGVEGEGDDRRARFSQATQDGARTFEWEAYRFGSGYGFWAFGSSAERLSLVAVLDAQQLASVLR